MKNPSGSSGRCEPLGATSLSPKHIAILMLHTGSNGTVVMSSVNGLVGTGFASRYRLQPRAGF